MVAPGVSPGKETHGNGKPRKGRQNPTCSLPPLPGLTHDDRLDPTAYAVGYRLPPLPGLITGAV